MAQIKWVGHAAFCVTGAGKTVYIDPWKLKGDEPKADFILVSHSHYDHLSAADIQKISKPETLVLGSADCADQIKGRFQALWPEAIFEDDGILVRAVPAYNPAKQFHPKANRWMGYLLTLEGKTVYYAGDTNLIPEMARLGSVDVALLPVGGTYTLTAEEAAQAAQKIKPATCIPYHYGDIVGSPDDAKRFAGLAGVPVQVLEPGGAFSFAK